MVDLIFMIVLTVALVYVVCSIMASNCKDCPKGKWFCISACEEVNERLNALEAKDDQY